MVDTIVEGLDRSKSVYIVTTKYEEVCDCLSQTFEKGITVLNAQGYFSGLNRKVVWIVLNRFQISRMRERVQSIDPYAYIAICDVADVFQAGGRTAAPAPGGRAACPAAGDGRERLRHHRTIVSAAFAQSFAPSVQL